MCIKKFLQQTNKKPKKLSQLYCGSSDLAIPWLDFSQLFSVLSCVLILSVDITLLLTMPNKGTVPWIPLV